jgi:hypothetical protein
MGRGQRGKKYIPPPRRKGRLIMDENELSNKIIGAAIEVQTSWTGAFGIGI